MTPERYQKIVQILCQRQPDLTLILDEVHKGRNLSAIVRSADANGIDTVHSVTPKNGFQHYRGTALGSHKWVEVITHDEVANPITQLKEQGHQIVAAHLSDDSLDYQTIDYTQPTAIVLGTEKYGISPAAAALVDHSITIPMKGMVASFNVSVACGIILAEARRQRESAGMYQQRRLADEVYQHRLFCWCHPQLAEFCDQRNLPYPAMDEKGDIIDGPQWHQDILAEAKK